MGIIRMTHVHRLKQYFGHPERTRQKSQQDAFNQKVREQLPVLKHPASVTHITQTEISYVTPRSMSDPMRPQDGLHAEDA